MKRNTMNNSVKFLLACMAVGWLALIFVQAGITSDPKQNALAEDKKKGITINTEPIPKPFFSIENTPYIRAGTSTIICVNQKDWNQILVAFADQIEKNTIQFYSLPILKERPGVVMSIFQAGKFYKQRGGVIREAREGYESNYHQAYGANMDSTAKEGDEGTLYYIPADKVGEPCSWKFVKTPKKK